MKDKIWRRTLWQLATPGILIMNLMAIVGIVIALKTGLIGFWIGSGILIIGDMIIISDVLWDWIT